VLQNWAVLVANQGDPAAAVRLLASIEAALAAIGFKQPPGPYQVFMTDVALVQQLLSAETFAATWAEGLALTLDEALALVLARYPSIKAR